VSVVCRIAYGIATMTIRTTRTTSTATRVSTRALISIACCVIIGLVFVAAALPKLLDPGSFAADIQNYRVLPERWVGHAALYVPALEIVVALGLFLPRYQRGAACLATLMLFGFAVAMAQARLRGIDLSCGCFGAAFESKVSWWTVARSGVLSVIAAIPVVAPPTLIPGARSSRPSRPSPVN
jgi:putative oxidoreductase